MEIMDNVDFESFCMKAQAFEPAFLKKIDGITEVEIFFRTPLMWVSAFKHASQGMYANEIRVHGLYLGKIAGSSYDGYSAENREHSYTNWECRDVVRFGFSVKNGDEKVFADSWKNPQTEMFHTSGRRVDAIPTLDFFDQVLETLAHPAEPFEMAEEAFLLSLSESAAPTITLTESYGEDAFTVELAGNMVEFLNIGESSPKTPYAEKARQAYSASAEWKGFCKAHKKDWAKHALTFRVHA